MSHSIDVRESREVPVREPAGARPFVLLSGLFLALQVASTDYGREQGAAGVWFLVGALLLWAVQARRSRVARGIVVVTSLVGTVLYALSALDDGHALLLAVLFAGQPCPCSPRRCGGTSRAKWEARCRLPGV